MVGTSWEKPADLSGVQAGRSLGLPKSRGVGRIPLREGISGIGRSPKSFQSRGWTYCFWVRWAMGRNNQDFLACLEKVWPVLWVRRDVDPSPGPACEPAYTELCGPENRQKVFTAISLEHALEVLPCPSPGSRKLPRVSPSGFTLLVHFPPHCAKTRDWCCHNRDWESEERTAVLF